MAWQTDIRVRFHLKRCPGFSTVHSCMWDLIVDGLHWELCLDSAKANCVNSKIPLIHEFILIFVAWELLFSNSVQRSWLYPPQLTLQVRVASIRRDFNCKVIALQRWDSNPRLRWRCRYVKSQTKLFPWDQGYIELGRQSGWLTNNHAAYSQAPTFSTGCSSMSASLSTGCCSGGIRTHASVDVAGTWSPRPNLIYVRL